MLQKSHLRVSTSTMLTYLGLKSSSVLEEWEQGENQTLDYFTIETHSSCILM